jgi:hypothetical protein
MFFIEILFSIILLKLFILLRYHGYKAYELWLEKQSFEELRQVNILDTISEEEMNANLEPNLVGLNLEYYERYAYLTWEEEEAWYHQLEYNFGVYTQYSDIYTPEEEMIRQQFLEYLRLKKNPPIPEDPTKLVMKKITHKEAIELFVFQDRVQKRELTFREKKLKKIRENEPAKCFGFYNHQKIIIFKNRNLFCASTGKKKKNRATYQYFQKENTARLVFSKNIYGIESKFIYNKITYPEFLTNNKTIYFINKFDSFRMGRSGIQGMEDTVNCQRWNSLFPK